MRIAGAITVTGHLVIVVCVAVVGTRPALALTPSQSSTATNKARNDAEARARIDALAKARAAINAKRQTDAQANALTKAKIKFILDLEAKQRAHLAAQLAKANTPRAVGPTHGKPDALVGNKTMREVAYARRQARADKAAQAARAPNRHR